MHQAGRSRSPGSVPVVQDSGGLLRAGRSDCPQGAGGFEAGSSLMDRPRHLDALPGPRRAIVQLVSVIVGVALATLLLTACESQTLANNAGGETPRSDVSATSAAQTLAGSPVTPSATGNTASATLGVESTVGPTE